MHNVYYTLVTVTKKLCGLNKQKLVVVATTLERSQANFTAIIHARNATNWKKFAKIGRVLSEIIGLERQTSRKKRQHLRKLGSSKVIRKGAI